MFAIRLPRVFFVEASAPKNSARISLSIPTSRTPSFANRFTVSEPINPAEPVTMIVRILTNRKKSGALTHSTGSGQALPTPSKIRVHSCLPARNFVKAGPFVVKKGSTQPENPCQSSSGRIHSRSRKVWIAVDYALDQILVFRCCHQKTNVPGMIDERKSERQSPGIKLWHKIRNHSSRRFFNTRGPRKQ